MAYINAIGEESGKGKVDDSADSGQRNRRDVVADNAAALRVLRGRQLGRQAYDETHEGGHADLRWRGGSNLR